MTYPQQPGNWNDPNSPAQPHWLDPASSDPPTPIPCNVSRFWDPNWSPDMKQIAFGCEP